jgi:filamentous hemagglutinin
MFSDGADKPSLLDPKGETHILDGDSPTSGGHRSGTGNSGKSEFPNSWSDDRIKGEISDIATDPKTNWSNPDRRGYVTGTGTRGGVDIKVVYDTKGGRIVTGYPTNLGKNP